MESLKEYQINSISNREILFHLAEDNARFIQIDLKNLKIEQKNNRLNKIDKKTI